MRLGAVIALTASALTAAAQSARVEWVTNRLEVPLSILSVQPISTPCPECGGPNHHEIRVQSVALFDQISVRVSTGAVTNVLFDHYGTTNVVVRTNVVLKVLPPPMNLSPYTHPGWILPPGMSITNSNVKAVPPTLLHGHISWAEPPVFGIPGPPPPPPWPLPPGWPI